MVIKSHCEAETARYEAATEAISEVAMRLPRFLLALLGASADRNER